MVAPFPANILGVKVELLVNATWTDISTYVYQRNPIQITGIGRADEQSTIQAAQATLTLNNRDGRFSPINTSGAYYPYITRNTQLRISVNSESSTFVTYSGYRFWGEVSEWPPAFDSTGTDVYANITVSGIVRRLSQNTVTIGSPYYRYNMISLTGSSAPHAYWAMEDGSGSTAWVAALPGESNGTFSGGPPSFGAVSNFQGSDAICQLNASISTFTVPSGGTPTNNVTRYLLYVPTGGDSASGTSDWCISETDSSGTVAKLEVYLNFNGTLTIDGRNSGGTILFTGTTTGNYQGVAILVSAELTPSGSNIAWALRVIKPGASSITESVTGTYSTSSTIAAVSKVLINRAGVLYSTAVGHLYVDYQVPSLTSAQYPLNGYIGEYAMDRFTRLCSELGIASETIGTNTSTATMGPQVDDTIMNVLQLIENTDCGLLYESRDQFGLGYRSLASMQSQSAALVVSFTSATLAGSMTPTYDDQMARNNVSVSNYDGFTVNAILTVGVMSVQAPPNGIGPGYNYSRNVSTSLDSQISGIANWLLLQGTVSQERYPTVQFDLSRSQVASFFSSIPSMRIGDYLQITNPPSFLVNTTIQQLVFGWSETINALTWTITFNTVPEIPYSSGYSPGTVVSNQVIGSPVSGNTSASTSNIEGLIQNAILQSEMLGQAIVSLSPDSQLVTISSTAPATPNNGDIWINSTTGLISQWESGAWQPTTFNATDVIQAGTIISSLIQAGTIVASNIAANTITGSNIAANTISAGELVSGIVVAGIVNATTITGAQFIATGTSESYMAYSGTPTTGNLLVSISGVSGTDAYSNSFPQGLQVVGSLVLGTTSGSSPSASPIGTTIWSDAVGVPAFTSPNGTIGRMVASTGQNAAGSSNATSSMNYLTPAYVIEANDTIQFTAYRISCGGHGTMGSTSVALKFQIFTFNTVMGLTQTGPDLATSNGFHWHCIAQIVFGSGGSSAAATLSGFFTWTTSVAGSSSKSYAFDLQSTSGLDCTSTTNIGFQAGWVATTGSPSIVCTNSIVERLGI
jgi:hypothetical protein